MINKIAPLFIAFFVLTLLISACSPKTVEMPTTEIISAQAAGEIELSVSDIVVNMPFVVWNGGKR